MFFSPAVFLDAFLRRMTLPAYQAGYYVSYFLPVLFLELHIFNRKNDTSQTSLRLYARASACSPSPCTLPRSAMPLAKNTALQFSMVSYSEFLFDRLTYLHTRNRDANQERSHNIHPNPVPTPGRRAEQRGSGQHGAAHDE